jgi:phytoene desaturase
VRERSVIIIGAGLAGLSTGCFAQVNGYRSQILEHHTQPGGVAAAWMRGEYLIDGGIHFVMGHKPGTGLYRLYRQLGIVPAVRFADMETYGRFVHEASGHSVVVGRDLARLAADLKALFPADERVADDLVAGARRMQGLDLTELGLSRPPELAGPLDQLRELWGMRHLFRYLVGRYSHSVARYAREVHDPVLRSFLYSLFLPGVPVWFLFMILGMLADGQLGLIDGSCLDLVKAMEGHYRALGGEVTYRATVEEIVVEEDRAVGVRLADGSEVRADAVVSAADGRSTIFGMLGGRYADEKIKHRYETWKTFQPLLMVNYGVARTFPEEPAFTTVALEHPLAIGGEEVDAFYVRIFNYSERFAPPGKTVLQVELETGWDYWHDLRQRDPAGYEAAKEEAAAQILARLERHYPGLSPAVEVMDVATPYTWWRYTRNHEGAWEGWLMTGEAMMTAVERTLPGLEGFYMAGQWVMPGGGVMPCLYSGRHAVEILCRDDGRAFVAEG